MKYDFIELPWDTEYFGVQAAKVVLKDKLLSKEFNEVLNKASKYDFITISNIHSNINNNRFIGSLSKAFLVDVNIQFEMIVQNHEGIEYYQPQNQYPFNDKVMEIAKTSFNHSRFFNDPYLDKDQSNEIYLNWVKNSFGKKDKFFLIAEEENEILGFLLFSINKEGNLVIELISLDRTSQGKGIGSKLIQSIIAFSKDNHIKKVNVGTQIDNIQAMNFYSKKGFNLISKSTIYHYWPRKEILND